MLFNVHPCKKIAATETCMLHQSRRFKILLSCTNSSPLYPSVSLHERPISRSIFETKCMENVPRFVIIITKAQNIEIGHIV